MKRKEVEQREPDTSNPLPVAQDSRPPEQVESTTRHIFVMKDSYYRCTRCGAEMNDRSLDEVCPAVKS
ncbi:MAG: hypothetical protein M3S32_06330 [Acidobacteriota bacterium]|nr:hypothetical protein [Acidobacteriota bacterium]